MINKKKNEVHHGMPPADVDDRYRTSYEIIKIEIIISYFKET